MKPVTKILFTDDNGIKFFGEGPLRLLRSVEKTGSLRAAAMEMEMAYSKASKLLKQAEANLGFALTTRSTGGKDGGGSVLTPEGKRWLRQYEAYRDACIKANRSLYRRFFPNLGCVIMASGLGKRFGGNKLMADFRGKPMIQRALDATEGLFSRRVVVTRHESVAQLAREQNVDVVLHDLPHRSDTVRLGLEALGDLDACMFLPGDQPLLRRETVAMLLENWKENPDSIIRPAYEDNEGSPVVFPAWAFPELKNLPEGKGGGVVIRKHPHEVLRVSVSNPFELADADTPSTLELLKGLCHD
jgi:molybdate transport repressor ModE-like protein